MMGKFEIGTKVRAIRDTESLAKRHRVGTVFVVGETLYPHVLRAGEFVAGPPETPSAYILPEEDFELVPATPEWSDVEAGDTVTFRDTTDNTMYTALATTRSAGSVLVLGAYTGSILTRDTRELLSIERPATAPEPESEWTPPPGTVAEIEVDGDLTYRAIKGDVDTLWHAENGDTYSLAAGDVTDIRPLVVIDPRTVDIHDLAIHNGLRDVPVRNLLADLGIVER